MSPVGADLNEEAAFERDLGVLEAVDLGTDKFVFAELVAFAVDLLLASGDFLGCALDDVEGDVAVSVLGEGGEAETVSAGVASFPDVGSALTSTGTCSSSWAAAVAARFAAALRPARLEVGEDSSSSADSVGGRLRDERLSGDEISPMVSVGGER